jgi:hypothetical protein
MMPAVDEDVSEVHSPCPFCSGEYVISGSVIRHSAPACSAFDGPDYLGQVRKSVCQERTKRVEEFVFQERTK